MDDFISEDDLHTFDGYLRYQAIDANTLTPEDLKTWREIFDEAMRRNAATPKVGLMKLQRVPGEEKYAVAIRDGSNLWLTLWIRCSHKGEVFIMYPRGERDWDAHASYHLDGTLHQKSYGREMGAPLKRQPLTGSFKGTEHLGIYGGHAGPSIGAICDPGAFTGVVEVEPSMLGPRNGAVSVDLAEPGCDPPVFLTKQVMRHVFHRTDRPSVVIGIGES